MTLAGRVMGDRTAPNSSSVDSWLSERIPIIGALTKPVLAEQIPTYAIDLLGFGRSDQPQARLNDEPATEQTVQYCFDLWAQQVADFCHNVIDRPVVLIGNSIGGVVALRAAQLLGEERCKEVVLIDCAQRLMDDKQLATQPAWMAWIRPLLKTLVSQRWLSTALFRNAAQAQE